MKFVVQNVTHKNNYKPKATMRSITNFPTTAEVTISCESDNTLITICHLHSCEICCL